MPSGEALVRHFVFGQRYFETRFGKRCDTAWLPDSLERYLSLFVERVSNLLWFLKLRVIAEMGIMNRDDLFLHAEVVLVSCCVVFISIVIMLIMTV